MEATLTESVCASLRVYLYRNATFLCERLYADFPSENNLHLLATCYFRSNQAYRAYHILKGSKSAQCRYLFALACFQMDSMVEAEAALLYPSGAGSEVPNGAAGYYMLGVICRLTDRRQAAIGHYTQALILDPFLWSAYEDLCLLGAEEEAAGLLGDVAVSRLQQQQQHLHWELRTQTSAPAALCIDHFDTGNGSHSQLRSSFSNAGSPKHSRFSSVILGDDTSSCVNSGGPGSGAISVSGFTDYGSNSLAFVTPTAGSSQVPTPGKNMQGIGSNLGGSLVATTEGPTRANIAAGGHSQQRRKFVDEGKFRKSIRSPSTRAAYSQVSGRLFDAVPRRSSRLAGESKSSALGSITSSGSGPGSSGAGGGLYTLAGSSGTTSRSSVEEDRPGGSVAGVYHGSKVFQDGALELLNLLRILGEGFRHLCMYRCQEAMQAFSKLPQQQFATSWVLCQVARACCEMVDYPEAERIFSEARRISAHHLEGADIFSTVLYHMKKDVELSYLAQETVAMDRLSPQAWCVMGNCFSLQKDHETALKFFQRALQLDSRFTYAYTLCGHEYVAMEDFEEGLICYRNAIRMDSRHYNAWYGLGTIYFRQEKYELAEYHFRRALQINSRSSVLHCYLGMALHALKKNEEALSLLEQAIIADVKNPLPKYQKANVLMSEERYDDALAELEQLKEVAPRESSVFFLMGKIYKRLDFPEKAMYHFCIALDLKPSTADVNLIKIAIEKLHVADDLEEENL
ncbi:anaphase-promoting complex subunit 3 [Marchantia polymorpha subsp. ruderalis]|uniref:Cdc23 domain-containing protein n=2 Tax=Marchantia polymorpha TaxID=3197 RepID=A0AAF6B3X5_MARPO|nr:hypothetical protein MARPO_0024s0107 [Marchantia polymorpha]BBN06709.1 hypothetical protein Mp_3g23310 [Marchantia polymorpha subsp. ruderalis]|eukprot:PTQ43606.1 hypothetical protein MARPO_0024s0107 [Marchantia polymorpha]